ncbi:hypothetical protein DB30_05936 [Enhygromyxa salina]|uniref:Gingipain domain-containing protein n=2 Tax=Enhygromyxa salina TaxID=215803 RepID=A0A0C2DH69_9BACT|nr:hypothetical protein DB30_05936 [Enhygromyxa salina]
MTCADERAPLLPEGIDGESSQAGAHEAQALPEYLWDEGGDPNDLELQRWGVFAPEGDRGERLLALVRPLIERREAQQGAPVQVYRVPGAMTALEAARWNKRVFQSADLDDDDRPRYQLMLGDLHELPLALQQRQASDGFVGRLAFDRDDDYAAYVAKLLASEDATPTHDLATTMFHTVHDGTGATRLGHRALVEPGLEHMRKRLALGKLSTRELLACGDEFDPSPDELLQFAAIDHPAVMFSLSHGDGPPRRGWGSAEQQRARQGAMSFGRAGSIEGTTLSDAKFLPGGLWFMLACYGAGTPDASAYQHWLAELKQLGQFRGKAEAVLAGIPAAGERPFIAAVPKATLASEHGPLAFVGHVDLAWSYSFQELDDGPMNRPSKFTGVLRSALRRDRMGISFRELYKYLGQTESELASIYDQGARGGEVDLARRGHLWMLRQDLSAYVLLGDPAARLCVRGGRAASQQQVSTPVSAQNFLGFPVAQSTETHGAALPLKIDELEEAIAKVILGDESAKAIARAYDVDRHELQELADAYQAAGRAALRGRS